jgi:hypothetical protein
MPRGGSKLTGNLSCVSSADIFKQIERFEVASNGSDYDCVTIAMPRGVAAAKSQQAPKWSFCRSKIKAERFQK